MLRGSPVDLLAFVQDVQAAGFPLASSALRAAAGQVGSWAAALQADLNARAQALAYEHPVELAGNRTYAYASPSEAIRAAIEYNRQSSGSQPVAVPLQLRRNISAPSGTVLGQGVSNDVWIGPLWELEEFLNVIQGRLAGPNALEDLLRLAGLSGSFHGRLAAAYLPGEASREAAQDPGDAERRALQQSAQALEAARRAYFEQMRNVLPGGEEALLEELWRRYQAQLGPTMNYSEFKAALTRPDTGAGTETAASGAASPGLSHTVCQEGPQACPCCLMAPNGCCA
jgi:hypothetical protein